MSHPWHYQRDGRQLGPVTESQLRQLLSSGQLRPSDLVRRDGSDEWVAAETVQDRLAAPRAGLPVARPLDSAAPLARPAAGGSGPPPLPGSVKAAIPVAQPVVDASGEPPIPVAALAVPSSASPAAKAKAVPAGPGKGKPGAKAKSTSPIVIIVVGGIAALFLVLAGGVYFFSDSLSKSLGPGGPGKSETAATDPPAPAPPKDGNAAPRNSGAFRPIRPPRNTPTVADSTAPAPSKPAAPPPVESFDPAKAEQQFVEALKEARTPEDHASVAKQGLDLVDRVVVAGDFARAKSLVVSSLAAARLADSVQLARRATVVHLQLELPSTDAVTEGARRRMAASSPGLAAREVAEPFFAPSVPVGKPLPAPTTVSVDRGVRHGKTESQRKRIFFDLLKAVDDYGMTPQGRAAWQGILRRNDIDAEAALSILDEGLGTFCDWEQPGGGKATSRIHRIEWVGARTRTRREPMLEK